MSKTIAIDFDDTFTADPEMWGEIIRLMKQRGHDPIMVTARRDTLENNELINVWLDKHKCQMRIYFTGLASKIQFMEKRGIRVDIWIDDDPCLLYTSPSPRD